mmetsp:Transcript_26791/g.68859  ORF Transcript_26791/g.68859 Transcript_26791/m.68859 type:complete len:237 (-) Transcript_26791:1512-2222(-)
MFRSARRSQSRCSCFMNTLFRSGPILSLTPFSRNSWSFNVAPACDLSSSVTCRFTVDPFRSYFSSTLSGAEKKLFIIITYSFFPSFSVIFISPVMRGSKELGYSCQCEKYLGMAEVITLYSLSGMVLMMYSPSAVPKNRQPVFSRLPCDMSGDWKDSAYFSRGMHQFVRSKWKGREAKSSTVATGSTPSGDTPFGKDGMISVAKHSSSRRAYEVEDDADEGEGCAKKESSSFPTLS